MTVCVCVCASLYVCVCMCVCVCAVVQCVVGYFNRDRQDGCVVL